MTKQRHIAYSLIAEHLGLKSQEVFRSVWAPQTYQNPSFYRIGSTVYAAPINNRMPELPPGAAWAQVAELHGRRIFAFTDDDAPRTSTQLALRPAPAVQDLALQTLLRDADLAFYSRTDIEAAIEEAVERQELSRSELELAAVERLRAHAAPQGPLIEWIQRPTSISAVRAVTVTASVELDGQHYRVQRISDNPALAEQDARHALRFIIAATR